MAGKGYVVTITEILRCKVPVKAKNKINSTRSKQTITRISAYLSRETLFKAEKA